MKKNKDMTSKCKKVFIRTFGCQQNVRDSEIILGMLKKKGYAQAESLDKADVVIFNTCSVRENAENRVWGNIGMLKKRKNGDSPQMRTVPIIGVVGCMGQNYKDEIFKRASGVDFVCGPANIYDIPKLLEKIDKQGTKAIAVDKDTRPLTTDFTHSPNGSVAFVSIMYGCDNFCSYCIVPYVRGRERSRPVKHVIDEIEQLVDRGVSEITLLGQNVNSYGKDLAAETNFAGLLRRLDKIEGLKCIHFMTSHPKDATIELFRAIRDLGKVAKELHLPLQSGSDRILKLMNRRYTSEKYVSLIKRLRSMIANCKISTDIIVGFPSETEDDFKKTYKIFEELKFNAAYIFKYSPRPPAKSAALEDDVPQAVKEKRHKLILELQKKISREYSFTRRKNE